jgi:hypothetical protein
MDAKYPELSHIVCSDNAFWSWLDISLNKKAKLSRIERPGEPTDKNPLQINKDGIAEKEFTQLYGGLHSGIAWRWK